MTKTLSALLLSLRQRLGGHGPALQDPADDPPVQKLVDSILRDAAQRRASEIQIGWWPEAELGFKSEFDRIIATLEEDQGEKDTQKAGRVCAVRYRIAGELHTAMTLPHLLYPAVVSHLKENAGLAPAARYDQTDPPPQPNFAAPSGHISREFPRNDGPKLLADFALAMIAEGEEEKALLRVSYSESPAN